MSEQNQRIERETAEQTGATASLWTVRQMLPGAWRKPVRHYMTEHDVNLAEVLAEALEEWGKAKGVDLPPRNPYLAWAS
jgi:hypothetical protein